MKTAVEWFYEWMDKNQYFIGNDLLKAFEQAKEMEKEHIIEACNQWFTEGCRYSTGFEQTIWYDEEDYYKKTYNK
jgi:hypothetical protein